MLKIPLKLSAAQIQQILYPDGPPKVVVKSKLYSGCYGGNNTNVGDIIVTDVTCKNEPISMENKQIIFLIDESGSMEDVMPAVRNSMLTMRNAFVRLLLPADFPTMTEEMLDVRFSELCTVSIITFSATAQCKWQSIKEQSIKEQNYSTSAYSEVIRNLAADTTTNLGAALELAATKFLPDNATWVIILTDGKANVGDHTTHESFRTLIRNWSSRIKIIPLGYGTEIDPELLSTLGSMIYIDSEEIIAPTLAGIAAEIVTSYGVAAVLAIPRLSVEYEKLPEARDVIGSVRVGTLFNDRSFTHGLVLHGTLLLPEVVQRYIGHGCCLTYYDLQRKTTVRCRFQIQGGNAVPDEVCEKYFAASTARILLGLQKNRDLSYLDLIRRKLEDWQHPIANAYKADVEHVIANITDQRHMLAVHSMASAMSSQNANYAAPGTQTPTVNRAVRDALNDFLLYSQ